VQPFSNLVRRNSSASAASYATYSASSHLPTPTLDRYDSSYATAPSPAYPSGASLELAEEALAGLNQEYNAVDPALGSQRSLSPLIGQVDVSTPRKVNLPPSAAWNVERASTPAGCPCGYPSPSFPPRPNDPDTGSPPNPRRAILPLRSVFKTKSIYLPNWISNQ
jgi:hypothetical protein